MQLWMILGFISAFGWALVVLLNKFVVDFEINDTMFSGSMHSLFNCVIIALAAVLLGGLPSLEFNALAGSIMGVLFILANYLWFSGVGRRMSLVLHQYCLLMWRLSLFSRLYF